MELGCGASGHDWQRFRRRCLGSFAWDGALRALSAAGHGVPRPRPRFGHLADAVVGPFVMLGSFHPSQQNTFTGKLTESMLDAVFAHAQQLASGGVGVTE